jgi:hypothetical protein
MCLGESISRDCPQESDYSLGKLDEDSPNHYLESIISGRVILSVKSGNRCVVCVCVCKLFIIKHD